MLDIAPRPVHSPAHEHANLSRRLMAAAIVLALLSLLVSTESPHHEDR